MAGLQELDIRQIKEVVGEATARHIPTTITLRTEEHWTHLRSRLVDVGDERILIEMPIDENGTPREFSPADRIGVTFKFKHHKYIFVATVGGAQPLALADGSGIQVLGLCWPTKMQRIQRRAFYRADVPAGSIVRASFWLGGRDAEPAGTTPDKPVFTGRVTNLSAGGLELHTSDPIPEALEVGYLFGLHVSFGTDGEPMFADAQLRRVARDEDHFVLGLQFVGLEQTSEGKKMLRFIASKVSEYQRISLREMSRSA